MSLFYVNQLIKNAFTSSINPLTTKEEVIMLIYWYKNLSRRIRVNDFL